MSKKQDSRRNTGSQTASRDPVAELERMFQKQQYKDAVKQAKLINKESPTPENHRLLERAYLLRAEQLQRSGMIASAVEVSGHLLEYGVTDAGLIDQFAQLLMKLGMAQEAYRLQGRHESPEAMGRLAALAADQAVLHPERSKALAPEIAQTAARIRQALEALAARDDDTALGLVRDVARGSPLSEWKLFIRGLAAFYRHDHADSLANWDRLDPERAPFRIARSLKDLDRRATAAREGGSGLEALESAILGEPILVRLQELRELIGKADWTDILRRIGPIRLGLRRVAPALAESLTRALIDPLIHHATDLDYRSGERLIIQFTRIAEPLAIDPRWNRLWGLVWEGPQGSPSRAVPFWESYLKDLETVPGFSDEERPLALALVWMHLGELYLDVVEDLSDEEEEYDDYEDDPGEIDLDTARRKALAAIERSLELAPRHRPTYNVLLDAYEEFDDEEKLEAAKLRVLQVFPDDLEVLTDLATSYLETNEPARALDYAVRARKLKPLDEKLQGLEYTVRILLARHMATQKRWDEGRAQFEIAARLRTKGDTDFRFLGRRAIFETKAGQRDLADHYEKEALARLVEPTPLWLVLHIESIRYGLTKAVQKHYADQLKTALRKKCLSETAGAMSGTLAAFLGTSTQYPGRDAHVKDVLGYLGRMSRTKFLRGDLEEVCNFLAMLPGQMKLYEKMVHRGLKDYSDSPIFQMMGASLEIEKGPFRMRPEVVRRHLDTALKLAEGSSNPEYARLVPRIKQQITVLSELTSGPLGFLGGFSGLPFGGGGPPMFGPFDDDDVDDVDDDFDEDDDFDDPVPFFGRSLPRPPSPGKKPKPKPKRRK